MNAKQFIDRLFTEEDKGTDVFMEFPRLCGRSDAGKSRGACSTHGHLSLSVDPQTVRDVAFSDNKIMLLITYPVELHNRILDELGIKEGEAIE